MVVALGGIIGSLARWAVSLGIHEDGFPWATLLVNYMGVAFLMAIVVYSNNHPSPKWWWRPALGSGFCGGFTTYSAFAVQVQRYLTENNFSGAIAYITVSIVGSYIIAVSVHKAMS